MNPHELMNELIRSAKILGLETVNLVNLTEDEIKKAYKKLAKKFHPDISKEENAEDKFKEINAAKDLLLDKLSVLKSGGGFRNPFMDGFPFGGNPFGFNSRPKEKIIDVIVSLKDLYLGNDITIAYRKEQICPYCVQQGKPNGCEHCNNGRIFTRVDKKIQTSNISEGMYVLEPNGVEYYVNNRIYTAPIVLSLEFEKVDPNNNFKKVGNNLIVSKLLSIDDILKLNLDQTINIDVYGHNIEISNKDKISDSIITIKRKGFGQDHVFKGDLIIILGVDTNIASIDSTIELLDSLKQKLESNNIKNKEQ